MAFTVFSGCEERFHLGCPLPEVLDPGRVCWLWKGLYHCVCVRDDCFNEWRHHSETAIGHRLGVGRIRISDGDVEFYSILKLITGAGAADMSVTFIIQTILKVTT